MKFVKAEKNDFATIEKLYNSVKNGCFCTWNEQYPTMEDINYDFDNNCLFVLKDNESIIGAISIVPNNELDSCTCFKTTNAREIARVAIDKEYQGKGISKVLVESIVKELKSRNIDAIHLSVAKKNIPAIKLYESCGFTTCGDIDMYNNSYYLCEKYIGDNK